MIIRTGYLCYIAGSLEVCRIVSVEVAPDAWNHDAGSEMVRVEVGSVVIEVPASQITCTWPASDEAPQYTPPPIRMGIISPDEAEVSDE